MWCSFTVPWAEISQSTKDVNFTLRIFIHFGHLDFSRIRVGSHKVTSPKSQSC